jgi:HEAT repeat protein
MEHPNGQARRGCRMGLSGCADGRHLASYQLLVDALAAKQSEVRQAAIVGLGSCRDARAVPALIQVLKKDSVPEVREFAALALGLIGDTRALEPLCATLRDPVEWARSAAAWSLGEIGDARAMTPLKAAVQADANKRFLVRAYRSQYLLGDHTAAANLAGLVTNVDWITRDVALKALLEHDEPDIAGSLVASLTQKSDADIIRALGRQRNTQALPLLMAVLWETDYSYQGNDARGAAAWALGMIAEGRQGELITEVTNALDHTATNDANLGVRAQAVLALARIGDQRGLARLDWVMQQYIPERNAAIRALWRFPDQRATELLAAALQDDDPLGRVLAARGLYLRDDPRGKTALKELVTTVTEPVAKQVAIRFAADLHDPELVPFYAKLAQAQHEEASIFLVLDAIGALGKYASPEAAQALIPLLDVPASRIREAAALSLKGTKNPAALAALRARLAKEDATRVRAAIQTALGK